MPSTSQASTLPVSNALHCHDEFHFIGLISCCVVAFLFLLRSSCWVHLLRLDLVQGCELLLERRVEQKAGSHGRSNRGNPSTHPGKTPPRNGPQGSHDIKLRRGLVVFLLICCACLMVPIPRPVPELLEDLTKVSDLDHPCLVDYQSCDSSVFFLTWQNRDGHLLGRVTILVIVVVVGPSYHRRVSKLSTVSGTRLLGCDPRNCCCIWTMSSSCLQVINNQRDGTLGLNPGSCRCPEGRS